jgi:hypothetical protein
MIGLCSTSTGCKSGDLVELRLYPCEFAGIEPRAVTVEITGYDDADAVVETFEVPFDDIDARTFADGYATVGYRKQGEVVRARFRVGWFDEATAGPLAEADAIAVYDELVPDAGEVLVLGEAAVDCAALADESGSESLDATDSMDSSSTDADSSTTDPSDSSTTDPSDSSTTDPSDTDTTDTTSTTGGDPPGPQPGDDCGTPASFTCSGGPTPTDAGQPLLCPALPPLELESTNAFAGSCVGACLDNQATPVNACGNIGMPAACLCESPDAPDCGAAELGCVTATELHLCFEGKVVVASCIDGCGMTPEGWFTCDS